MTQGWSTFSEFASDYEGNEIDRFVALAPAWAFDPDPTDFDLAPTDPAHGGKVWK